MQLNFSQTVINNSKISSGSVRTFCGSSWMTQNSFKKCCCHLCASKNRFSTNSYVSMPDLSLRNVNMIFHRVLFTASISLPLSHATDNLWNIYLHSLNVISPRWSVEGSPKVTQLLVQHEDFAEFHSSFHWKCPKALQRFVGESRQDAAVRHADLYVAFSAQHDMRWVDMIMNNFAAVLVPKKRSKTAVGKKRVKKTFVDRARSWLS